MYKVKKYRRDGSFMEEIEYKDLFDFFNDVDLYEMIDDMIDETNEQVLICGIGLVNQSRVLKEFSPVDYQFVYNDYINCMVEDIDYNFKYYSDENEVIFDDYGYKYVINYAEEEEEE